MVESFTRKTSRGKALDTVTNDHFLLHTVVHPECGIREYCHPARLSDEHKLRTFNFGISTIFGKLNPNRKNLYAK